MRGSPKSSPAIVSVGDGVFSEGGVFSECVGDGVLEYVGDVGGGVWECVGDGAVWVIDLGSVEECM